MQSFDDIATDLAAVGRRLDACGWVRGTSGNFSAVIARQPLRLAVTSSAAAKGSLCAEQILEIDASITTVGRHTGTPSAEALLHVNLVQLRGAGAVLHTHSIWATMLSDQYATAGGLAIEGYEMLKGLDGVTSHEHSEWLPIVENDQDMPRLRDATSRVLAEHPGAHGVLIRRHGLYTWGDDLAAAVRHVEILEFLLEVVAQTQLTRRALAAVRATD